MSRQRWAIIAGVAMSVICLMLSGCFQPIRMPSVKTYTLQRSSQYRAPKRRASLTLLVSEPVASPGYETTKMIYVNRPYQLSRYTRNKWVASPAQMLLPLLVESLRNTRHYKAVVGAPFVGKTDLRLDTRIVVLEQEFVDAHHSRVRVVMKADLVNSRNRRLLASQYFARTVSAPPNPYGGVVAANQAVQAILSRISRFTVRNTGRVLLRLERPIYSK